MFFFASFGSLTGAAAATGSGVGTGSGLATVFAPAAYSFEDVPTLVDVAFLGGDAGLLVAAYAFFGDRGYFLGGAMGFF